MSKSTHPKAVPSVSEGDSRAAQDGTAPTVAHVTVMFCTAASAALRSGRLIRLAVYVPPPLSC